MSAKSGLQNFNSWPLAFSHDINSPLTALLAEAQMLALDERLPEVHSADVDQIVELARRVAAVVRELDSLRGEVAPA